MQTVLTMPAIQYYCMLNESFRLDAEQKIEWLNITASPDLEQSDRSEMFRSYKERAQDLLIEGILPTEDTGYDGLEQILG